MDTEERYKSISKETQGILKGEYGATPAPVNKDLQDEVLEDNEQPITCRPTDNIEPELEALTLELEGLSSEHGFNLTLSEGQIDDVLTYALFPQVGLKFPRIAIIQMHLNLFQQVSRRCQPMMQVKKFIQLRSKEVIHCYCWRRW